MVPIHLLVAPPPLPCYQTNRRRSSSLVVLLGLELGGGVGHAHAQLLGALDDLLALAGRHVVRDLGRVLPERHRHTRREDKGSAFQNLAMVYGGKDQQQRMPKGGRGGAKEA